MDTETDKSGPIVLVLPHLGIGGAQRVASTLARYWASQGHNIHVLTTMKDKPDFYSLGPGVKRHTLGCKPGNETHPFTVQRSGEPARDLNTISSMPRGSESGRGRGQRTTPDKRSTIRTIKPFLTWPIRQALLIPRTLISRHFLGRNPATYETFLRLAYSRVRRLRFALEKIDPSVVVSFLGATNIMTVAATRDLPARLIISERNDPRRQALDQPWESLRPMIYPLADVVTANSHGALQAMEDYCPAEKLAYVPNPLVIPEGSGAPRKQSILFLARLVPQKAPEVLVEAFARFAGDNPHWALELAGDGPMEEELRARVAALGLGDRVVFHGLVKNPTPLLMKASIFALPSRFEGTPNSLLEAMAAKLACIVSDSSPGPLNLVEHGVSGLITRTDDIEDLTNALSRLAKDTSLRNVLAHGGFERIGDYRLEKVAAAWERLFYGQHRDTPDAPGR